MRGPEHFLPAERIHDVRRSVQHVLARLEGTHVARIGNTPLARLDKVRLDTVRPAKVRIYVKLEGFNPSGSVKDRVALYLLADGLGSGKLTADQSVLEASSGNTGIALSMVGARLGIRVVITVPDNVSVERHKIIRAYGARPLLTVGERGTRGSIDRAQQLLKENAAGLYWTAQHYNDVNSFAHYETTGPEIIDQLAEFGETKLDAFVATSGTTGTLMGTSVRLRETFPEVQIVAVWPQDKIMGIRKPEGENRPSIYREELVHRIIQVTNKTANDMVGQVATLEGILLGPSGGAAITAALQVAEELEARKGDGVVVVIVPDWGERYLSLEGFKPVYGRRATDVPGQRIDTDVLDAPDVIKSPR